MSHHYISVETFRNGSDLDCHWSVPGIQIGKLVISANLESVRHWSTKVREELDKFVHYYKSGDINSRTKKGRKSYRAHLKLLAIAGHNLYVALTTDSGSSPTATPESMCEWLDETSRFFSESGRACRIHFTVPDNLHIPWGLIYDADPEQLSFDDNKVPTIDDYNDFWGIKFTASSVHSTIPLRNPKSLPGESFHLLSAINNSVYDKAYSVLSNEEQGSVDGFWQGNVRVYNEAKLKEEWRKIHAESGILYFYCHANGTSIELSDTEPLQAEDLYIALRRPKKPGVNLASVNFAFFNGCNTATGPERHSGESGRSFMEIIKALEFRGYIGTESKIPDVFALRFGFDFLFYFLHGKGCLLEAMGHLRRKHWPLSLVYTINCDPLVAISRSSVPPFPDRLSDDNFSLDRIGSNLLQLNLEAL